MVKGYIAYEGEQFTIEWYYSEKGESQAFEYYLSLASIDRVKVLRLFKIMGDIGKIQDECKFRNEGEKIYAFKPKPHRFLSFFVEGKKIIVTNAFWKKQDKLPTNERDRALMCRESYKSRIKAGTYYEEDEEKN